MMPCFFDEGDIWFVLIFENKQVFRQHETDDDDDDDDIDSDGREKLKKAELFNYFVFLPSFLRVSLLSVVE